MRRRGVGKRGEGLSEYVVITSMLLVCAVVGLFSLFGNVRIVAGELRLCLDCTDPVELAAPEEPGEDGAMPAEEVLAALPMDSEGGSELLEDFELASTTGTSSSSSGESWGLMDWSPPWLSDLFGYFSGAPYLYA